MTRIAASGVATLAWFGDALVDWASGHVEYHLDGSTRAGRFTSYGRRFDTVVTSRDGRNVVIYERFGTKGALIRDGEMLRELDRSFYFADAYEFPVAFVDLPGGGMGLVHCPKEYDRLEIDDVVTGRRLTEANREPADFFHSCLSTSPSGRRFASAGWIWHPWEAIEIFDVDEALRSPGSLDHGAYLRDTAHVGYAAAQSVAWLTDDIVAFSGAAGREGAPADGKLRLEPSGLAAFDLRTGACLSSVVMPELVGTIVGVDPNHVLSFHREPKLIRVDTGEVLLRWPELASGNQAGCLRVSDSFTPPRAFDRDGRRFAIASKGEIVVVQLDGLPTA